MKKKKILFIMPSMFIGGAERSLLGLLDSFDYSKYEVSLFLYRHEGELLNQIPDQVNLLPEIKQYRTFDVPIKGLLLSPLFVFGCARIIGKIAKKLHLLVSDEPEGVWMRMQYTSKYLLPLLPPIPGEYDLGVMFLGIADVLLKRVIAKKKITWNHTDYSELFPNKKYDLSIYRDIDLIASVSEQCTKKILSVYPNLINKTITIENILSKRIVEKQSQESIFDMNRTSNEVLLLSIGRYSDAKNFDNIPEICKYILIEGINVRWFIIGFGGDEELIRQRIAQLSMKKHVVLLGKKENPYPYIKACDIYVQPSRYEGKCVTVREAQMLKKPVVITKYSTSSSQLEDGFDGVIVPLSNAECAKGIVTLIKNKILQYQLIKNTSQSDYSNKEEITKIYQLIE